MYNLPSRLDNPLARHKQEAGGRAPPTLNTLPQPTWDKGSQRPRASRVTGGRGGSQQAGRRGERCSGRRGGVAGPNRAGPQVVQARAGLTCALALPTGGQKVLLALGASGAACPHCSTDRGMHWAIGPRQVQGPRPAACSTCCGCWARARELAPPRSALTFLPLRLSTARRHPPLQ